MKKNKLLIELIKSSTKAKIFTGLVVAAIVITGGAVAYNHLSNNGSAFTDEEKKEMENNSEIVEMTEEEKKEFDTNIKIRELKMKIQEIKKDADISHSEGNSEKDLEYYSTMLESIKTPEQKEKEAQKEEAEKIDLEKAKEEINSQQPGDTNTKPNNQNPAPPSEPKPEPKPEPTPTPPPAPSTPSQWIDTSQAVAAMSTGSTNKPQGNQLYSAENYSVLLNLVNGWFSGSGESMSSINSKVRSQFPNEGFPLLLTNLVIFSIDGVANTDSIMNGVYSNRTDSNHKSFIHIKAYYDSSSNKTTIWFAGGAI